SAILLGVITYSKSSTVQKVTTQFLGQFLNQRTKHDFWFVFTRSIGMTMLSMVILFLLGGSLFGTITVPLFFIFCGFWFGAGSSSLYLTYSLKGIAFYAIAILPPSAVFSIGMLIAGRKSIDFSLYIVKLTLPKSVPIGLYVPFKNYCAQFLAVVFLAVLSAVLDALLSISFLKYFSLQ
ncbi:MAG: hypothetical protein IKI29_00995, partial [Clostridia bacterium]|nr:hypothetical protein [Clostridia bacterium]